eukprot:CCRYP_005138-RA/>CCRYP_005138-RA protein AED:0.30 eAED:0.73 QI:0/1/0.5/1/1/1/2/282/185
MPFFLILVAAGVINHLIQRQQEEAPEGDSQRENESSSETGEGENFHGDSVLDAITHCCGSPGSGAGRDDACSDETKNAVAKDTAATTPTETNKYGEIHSNKSTAFQGELLKDSASSVAGDAVNDTRSWNSDSMNTRACEYQYHSIPTDESGDEQSVGVSENKRDDTSKQRPRRNRQQKAIFQKEK